MSSKKKTLSMPSMSPLAGAIALALAGSSSALSAATITVDSLGNGPVDTEDGDITLNDAISIAEADAAADTIVFNATLAGTAGSPATIDLDNYFDQDIDNPLVIDGSAIVDEFGALNLVIDDEGYEVNLTGTTLTIGSLTVEADEESGAFIYASNGSSVTLSAVDFEASDTGFAIFSYNSDVTVSNSEFYDAYSDEDGGAISFNVSGESASNTLSITDSTFYGSYTADNGGDISVSVADGSAALNIAGTTFNSSSASENGGAIFVNAYSTDGTPGNVSVSLTNSTFYDADTYGNGGALAVVSGSAPSGASTPVTLTVDGVTFDENKAGNYSEAYGADIFVLNQNANSSVTVTNSTFMYSRLNQGAGSIAVMQESGDLGLSVSGSTFDENGGSFTAGGAVFASVEDGDTTLSVTDSTFSYLNSYGADEGDVVGGAVTLWQFDGEATVTATGNTFNDNEGEGGASLAIVQYSPYVYISGDDSAKALGNTKTLDITVSGNTFHENDAYYYGGALLVNHYGGTDVSLVTNVTVSGNTFDENRGESGGAAVFVAADDFGSNNNLTLSLSANTFTNNSSEGEGIVGVFHQDGVANVTSTTDIFSDNFGSNIVFALDASSDFTANIADAVSTNNESEGDGGFLSVNATGVNEYIAPVTCDTGVPAVAGFQQLTGADANITISNSLIDGNMANEGAAVSIDADTAASVTFGIIGSSVVNNYADDDGGAFHINAEGFNEYVDSIVAGTDICANEIAAADGYTRNTPATIDFSVTNTTVAGNFAESDGGAVYAEINSADITMNFVNATIASNGAAGDENTDRATGGVSANSEGDDNYGSLTINAHNTVIARNNIDNADDDEVSSAWWDLSFEVDVTNGTFNSLNSHIESPKAINNNPVVLGMEAAVTSRFGVSAGLGELIDDGAGNWTISPNDDSPLIDRGDVALAIDNAGTAFVTDQLGAARLQGDNVDIGAVETAITAADSIIEPEVIVEEKSGGFFGSFNFGYLLALTGLLGFRRKK